MRRLAIAELDRYAKSLNPKILVECELASLSLRRSVVDLPGAKTRILKAHELTSRANLQPRSVFIHGREQLPRERARAIDCGSL